jgi:hypothetical protein
MTHALCVLPTESLVVLGGVDSQLGEWVDGVRSQSTGLFTQLLAGRQTLLPHGEYVLQGALVATETGTKCTSASTLKRIIYFRFAFEGVRYQ